MSFWYPFCDSIDLDRFKNELKKSKEEYEQRVKYHEELVEEHEKREKYNKELVDEHAQKVKYYEALVEEYEQRVESHLFPYKKRRNKYEK